MFVSPFWLVKRVDRIELANAVIKPTFDSGDENNSIKIPLLTNTLEVQQGDEVKVFQPKQVTRELEPLTPVPSAEPPAKRLCGKQPGQPS